MHKYANTYDVSVDSLLSSSLIAKQSSTSLEDDHNYMCYIEQSPKSQQGRRRSSSLQICPSKKAGIMLLLPETDLPPYLDDVPLSPVSQDDSDGRTPICRPPLRLSLNPTTESNFSYSPYPPEEKEKESTYSPFSPDEKETDSSHSIMDLETITTDLFDEVKRNYRFDSTEPISCQSPSESVSSCGTSGSSASMDMMSLVGMVHSMDEQIDGAENGYTFHEKQCSTVQGELWIGETLSGDPVAIKKIDQRLHSQMRTKGNEDDLLFLVEQDVEKEAHILKTLNANSDTAQGIVRYIDFFESDSSLHLVTEYIDGISMNEFILIAHQYIYEGAMKQGHWVKIVKEIMFQIISTINRLHRIHRCCHLDLVTENVMIVGANFKKFKNGTVLIVGRPKAILIDFGVAEIFEESLNSQNNSRDKPRNMLFPCTKTRLSLSHEIKQCPESLDGRVYDAASADMWSIGMILYEGIIGEPLYSHVDDEAYEAVRNGALYDFMVRQKLLPLFDRSSFLLLSGLLNINRQTRLNSEEAQNHIWFVPEDNQ